MQLLLIPGWLAAAYRDAHRPLTQVLTLSQDYAELYNDRPVDLPLTMQDIEWYGYFNKAFAKVLPKPLLEGFEYGTDRVLGFSGEIAEAYTKQLLRCETEAKKWGLPEYHKAIQSTNDNTPDAESEFEYTMLNPVWLSDTTLGLVVVNHHTQRLKALVNTILYHLYTRSRLSEVAKHPLFTYFFQLSDS